VGYLLLEFFHAFDFEGAAEELLGALLGVVDVLVWAVAAIPSLRLGLLDDCHAKVCVLVSTLSKIDCVLVTYLSRRL
jgi:hypothetical protein